MRRAVAACTSPEVFFGSASQGVAAGQTTFPTSGDPLGLAMESLDLYNSS